jgi:hypothetical protein
MSEEHVGLRVFSILSYNTYPSITVSQEELLLVRPNDLLPLFHRPMLYQDHPVFSSSSMVQTMKGFLGGFERKKPLLAKLFPNGW